MNGNSPRKAPGDEKFIICNADEGEPGTFKDRLILEGDPHKLIEGMIIAGYAVGATQGYIYIRGEYALSIERMEKAIADARALGLLGTNIFDKAFQLRHRGHEGCRRLRVRRGDGPHRVPRRTQGPSKKQAALPGRRRSLG